MDSWTPRLSIGLPVYNGQKYLGSTVDSILRQPFGDFELIISDNASTDATQEICRTYAAGDRRVRYHRNERNLGVAWNHNRVFELSSGEYFMWAAYDDVRAPEYISKCVEFLSRNPETVLCYSKIGCIDEHGQISPAKYESLNVDSPMPEERFRSLIRMDHTCEMMYGVIRRAVLIKTGLNGRYPDSDRVLLAELALHGPFYEIPERLFFRREHAQQSTIAAPSRYERMAWFAPEKAGKIVFPYFREFKEFLSAIGRAPVCRSERIRCFLLMIRWLGENRRGLKSDLSGTFYYFQRDLRRRMGLL